MSWLEKQEDFQVIMRALLGLWDINFFSDPSLLVIYFFLVEFSRVSGDVGKGDHYVDPGLEFST